MNWLSDFITRLFADFYSPSSEGIYFLIGISLVFIAVIIIAIQGNAYRRAVKIVEDDKKKLYKISYEKRKDKDLDEYIKQKNSDIRYWDKRRMERYEKLRLAFKWSAGLFITGVILSWWRTNTIPFLILLFSALCVLGSLWLCLWILWSIVKGTYFALTHLKK